VFNCVDGVYICLFFHFSFLVIFINMSNKLIIINTRSMEINLWKANHHNGSFPLPIFPKRQNKIKKDMFTKFTKGKATKCLLQSLERIQFRSHLPICRILVPKSFNSLQSSSSQSSKLRQISKKGCLHCRMEDKS
jgi:hypothetical protein